MQIEFKRLERFADLLTGDDRVMWFFDMLKKFESKDFITRLDVRNAEKIFDSMDAVIKFVRKFNKEIASMLSASIALKTEKIRKMLTPELREKYKKELGVIEI